MAVARIAEFIVAPECGAASKEPRVGIPHETVESDALEVSVLESGGIFQAVTQQAVEKDVRQPDERRGHQRVAMGRNREEKQDDRQHEKVAEVVAGRAHARPAEVAQHKEIGREEEDGEQQPAEMQIAVKQQRQDEQDSLFDTEKQGWTSEHGRSFSLKKFASLKR